MESFTYLSVLCYVLFTNFHKSKFFAGDVITRRQNIDKPLPTSLKEHLASYTRYKFPHSPAYLIPQLNYKELEPLLFAVITFHKKEEPTDFLSVFLTLSDIQNGKPKIAKQMQLWNIRQQK